MKKINKNEYRCDSCGGVIDKIMTNNQANTCNRCLQTSEKLNKIGQCPACSKEGDWARKMTLRGRDLKNISGFQEMVKKERVKLFAELL